MFFDEICFMLVKKKNINLLKIILSDKFDCEVYFSAGIGGFITELALFSV